MGHFNVEKEAPDYSIIRQYWYVRNIIVHNNSKVNKKFLMYIKSNEYKLNDEFKFSIEDMKKLFNSIHNFASIFANFFYSKFK